MRIIDKGFTLVELLASIAIMTVILVMTMPSFKNMLMNNRIMAQTDALVNTLHYARNTALTQNRSILVCPYRAVGSSACGSDWQNGWITITQPAVGSPLLLHAYPASANGPVLSSVPVNGAATSSVLFDPRGLNTTPANFKLCDSRGASYAQSVGVLLTGFVQSGSTTGKAAWDGSNLTCP